MFVGWYVISTTCREARAFKFKFAIINLCFLKDYVRFFGTIIRAILASYARITLRPMFFNYVRRNKGVVPFRSFLFVDSASLRRDLVAFIVKVTSSVAYVQRNTNCAINLRIRLIRRVLSTFTRLIVVTRDMASIRLRVLGQFPFRMDISVGFFTKDVYTVDFMFNGDVANEDEFSVDRNATMFAYFEVLIRGAKSSVFWAYDFRAYTTEYLTL